MASNRAKGLKRVREGGEWGEGLFREDLCLKGVVLRSGREEGASEETGGTGRGARRGGEGERISWRSFSKEVSSNEG